VCGKSLAYWYDCRWTGHLKEKGLLDRYRRDLEYRNSQLGGRERYEASFLEPDDAMDGFSGGKVVDWIGQYDIGKPFFLHASLCAPHFPLDPPKAHFERYRPEDMPSPPGVDDEEQSAHWRQLRALYCGLIELVDEQVGRIMDALQRRGWSENTVVAFCTDHGDMIGDLGRNHKSLWQDPSCRTPLTVSYPEVVEGGRILDLMVESVDLPCALLAIAGCDPTRSLPQTPGRSFWNAVTGRGGGPRKWAYSECGIGEKAWRMVCDRTWKYVWHASEGEMLFRREDDPHDELNLAAAPSSGRVLDLMKGRLIESMSRCVAPNTVPFFATGEF